MNPVNDSLKSNNRLKEIVTILAKYGFADWLDKTDIDWLKKYFQKADKENLERYTFEQRVRLAITELGTTFIKFGQILSTRNDLVSPALIKELEKLQSATPKDGIAKVRKRIKTEFGVKSIDELFAEFESKPIASASIAQVHKATLHSGEAVVVKVMHEGIEGKVQEDLKIMNHLAGLAQKYSKRLQAYQPQSFIRQFSQTMMDELDFNMEFQNIERFRQNFEGDDRVVFPEAYAEQSGKTVLTMSFVHGFPLKDVDELEWNDEQRSTFTLESADVFMEMMFRDRFYHADPHPGNLLVRPDGSLGLIDCGMVAKIDHRSSQLLEELITGVAEKNTELLKNTIIDMCSVPKTTDTNALEIQIEDFIEKYLDLPLNQFDMSAAINEGVNIIRQHQLILPANISSLFRVVVMLEGSSRLLNPGFNITVLFKKYHKKILKRKLAPKALVQRMSRNIHAWEQIIDQLPKTINRVVKNVGKDDFEINLEHRNLEKSVNRIVKGLITASVFLGSSLLWAFKVPPVYEGYSIVGLSGVLISAYMTYQILKEINQ